LRLRLGFVTSDNFKMNMKKLEFGNSHFFEKFKNLEIWQSRIWKFG